MFRLFLMVLSVSALSGCGGDNNSDTQQSNSNLCILKQDLQQEMLQYINEARSQSRSCGSEGNFSAAAAVSWNDTLYQASLGHSQDMAKNNFFSHTGSDGLTLKGRLDTAGYKLSTAGENIAAGQTSSKAVVDAWMNSDGHCKNIMTSGFTEIGAACIRTESGDYTHYWTLVLASPQ